MRRVIVIAALCVLIGMPLILAACGDVYEAYPADVIVVMGTPLATNDLVVLEAAQTQKKDNADDRAIATAEIERLNAQATLYSANATLNAARTQDQNNADTIAAQLASTAAIEQARALATLNAAISTQNAALTQDAILQTQVMDQQNMDALAAGTRTAVANNIATQTRAAAATSQWYADQERQREEKRKEPIAILWMVCLSVIIVCLAVLIIWAGWRWRKNHQVNGLFLESPVDRLPAPSIEVIQQPREDFDDRNDPDQSNDQVTRWMDEVKRKLLSRDKKGEEDDSTN